MKSTHSPALRKDSPDVDYTLLHQRFFDCEHKESELRVYTASNGTKHYRRQCLRCGRLVETVRRADIRRDLARLPAWDEDLPRQYWETRNQLYRQALDAIRSREKQEFWDWYESYLETGKWKRIRQRVLKRAGGICEGCGQQQATQVHHLNYSHVGEEFMFELVAVCRDCHARLHPDHEEPAAPRLILQEGRPE